MKMLMKKKFIQQNCIHKKQFTPVSSSYTVYIILFSLFFTINIGIATYFIYYKYINHDKKTVVKEGSVLQTIYWIKFLKHIKIVKYISIKNRSYYCFNNMIALKDFDGANLKVDKKSITITFIFITLVTSQLKN